jgi:predicted TIM-barrel fold metal-dependent hydrolase
MIIDAHVHLKHGDEMRTEYGPETILEVMDAVGIGKSVVFAMSTTTRRSIEMAREAVERFPDRLIPYVYAIPSYERAVLDEIDEAISNLGFRGIKIHVGECTLAEYVVDPVIELAGRKGVPCLIDCAGRYRDVERMASSFPETRIIVAHLGMYLCRDGGLIDRFIRMAEVHENIYLDISGVVMVEKIKEAVDRVGANRVIFGTDGPQERPDVVSFARSEIEKVKGLSLGREDEEMVLGGTISGLLGLEEEGGGR